MSFPAVRALPFWQWNPRHANPARFTSTIPVWVGCPVSLSVCQILRDRLQGWLGLASRAADHHHVVRIPREVTPRALRLCPVHIQHL